MRTFIRQATTTRMTKKDRRLDDLRRPILWLGLVGLLTVASAKTDEVTAPVVEINGGLVRGLTRNKVDGHQVNLYQGIRYGRAERFRKATPVEPWTGIYEATEPANVCPQPNLNLTLFKQYLNRMSEDCLFLDVWQPAAKSSQKRSVMVWIHGGGFMMGSINQYDLAQFAGQGDVVVVSLNYRLGSLAFVNGGTELESGNLALYDQILALEWVQQNVDQFGGNPQDVTIFGESAGGWAVGLLTLSPLTEGLFHRAILQSGAPYDNLFSDSKKESLQKTLEFAKRIDCLKKDNGQNIKQSLTSALSCLREKPASDLVKFSVKDDNFMNLLYPYHGDQLLPLPINQALQQFDRKLDVMFGVTRDEGSLMLNFQYPDNDFNNITLDSTRETILKVAKQFPKLPNAHLVMEHYTKHLTKDSSKDELRRAIFDIPADYMLVCPTVLFGQQIARRVAASHKENHFYAYRLMAPIETLPAWMGVTHGQDLSYLFNIDIMGELPQNSKSFNKLSRDMVTAWTEFAKTGKIPTISGVEWTEAIDRQQPEQLSVRYFSLDSADYKMVDNYWKITCEQFWKQIIFSTKKSENENAKTEL